MRKFELAIGAAGILFLGGCVSPAQYETTPVEVQSAQGVVLCQLYTREITVWDRAIDRPDTMSVQEGDAICRAEGLRRLETT